MERLDHKCEDGCDCDGSGSASCSESEEEDGVVHVKTSTPCPRCKDEPGVKCDCFDVQLKGPRWWELSRTAVESGSLDNFRTKGRARRGTVRSVSFRWAFIPTTEAAATRSSWFDWLGMSWSVRLQRSPHYSEHVWLPPDGWSLFVDVRPPYVNVHRVRGEISLSLRGEPESLWKFEEDFQPAWHNQEVCTHCSRCVDIDTNFVQNMCNQKQDIVLHVKLNTLGLGRETSSFQFQGPHASLLSDVVVGTIPFKFAYAWDINAHLQSLSDEDVAFWKSLAVKKKGADKVKFGPRDLVFAAGTHLHIHSLYTWKACQEIKNFVTRAAHEAIDGMVFIPYEILFLDYDLMDGNDEMVKQFAGNPGVLGCLGKHLQDTIVPIFDWIVKNPLIAAAKKYRNKSVQSCTNSFQQIKTAERRLIEVQCGGCQKSGVKANMNSCGGCKNQFYCSKNCQSTHWKEHKRFCSSLKQERTIRRTEEKPAEEEKAKKLQAELYGAKKWFARSTDH